MLPGSKPRIHLNIDDWMPHLEEWDVPESKKIEFIETLWFILCSFNDRGWDIVGTPETSGQTLDLTAALQTAVLNSQHEREAL